MTVRSPRAFLARLNGLQRGAQVERAQLVTQTLRRFLSEPFYHVMTAPPAAPPAAPER